MLCLRLRPGKAALSGQQAGKPNVPYKMLSEKCRYKSNMEIADGCLGVLSRDEFPDGIIYHLENIETQ